MKVEVNQEITQETEISIDIAQVLAANQTLLKNMARKIDSLESKMTFMEKSLIEYSQKAASEQKLLSVINSPSKRIIEPWKPKKKLSSKRNELSFFDKFFSFFFPLRKVLNSIKRIFIHALCIGESRFCFLRLLVQEYLQLFRSQKIAVLRLVRVTQFAIFGVTLVQILTNQEADPLLSSSFQIVGYSHQIKPLYPECPEL